MEINTSVLINIVLYAFIIAMVFNMFKSSKAQKKRKELINCVAYIKDKDAFFQSINAVIENQKDDPTILNKARILKLWGIAYHKDYDNFEELLNEIDLNVLITSKKNTASLEDNEDSFFYMYLGIPNILYADDRADLRAMMNEKMASVEEQAKGTIVREISLEINKYYDTKDDSGLAFYEKVLDGDYSEYRYAKSLIGLYKSIVNAMAARIYLDHGDTAKYQDAEPMLKDFKLSGVGQRWLASIGIELPEEKPAETEDADETSSDSGKETFQITEESAKNADVIDAEVVKEEEKKEDQE